MLRFGEAPYLECSSKGDKRFSAFYARIPITSWGSKYTIEEMFQASKVFSDGSWGCNVAEAKGRRPVAFMFRDKRWPVELHKEFYYFLWWVYLVGNKELTHVILTASGFSDMFGQEGHCCQAEAIWQFKQGKKPYLFNEENWEKCQ